MSLNTESIVLNNGLTVILDSLETVDSATVGIWSKIGSRVENASNNGLCHFLEHMVFKGTKNRSCLEIADAIESKGGYINAWTSKEKTAWFNRVLSDDVPLSIELLLDILINSLFPQDELAKEKGVIKEEIKMYLDSPQSLAYNLCEKLCFGDNSLSYPIIGNETTVDSFTSKDFFDHLNKFYTPNNMVLVISGKFDKQASLETIKKFTKGWQPSTHEINLTVPQFKSHKELLIKDNIEQTVILYSLPACSYKHKDYYKALVSNSILGVGMSSRFFKEIREARGLAYYVHSSINAYQDTGTFCAEVGCNYKNANLVINLLKEQIENATKNLEDKEITTAKNQLRASLLMSLEKTYNRADHIAHSFLSSGYVKDTNKIINEINQVTKQDILSMFQSFLDSKESIAVVSNKDIPI